MREILFRGKRVDNGEWVYGNYVHTDCFEDHNDFIFQNDPTRYVIDPETLCEYTGLTDKSGKKIFEGDILEYDFGEDLYGVIGEPYKLGKRNATVYYSSKYHSFLLKPCGNFAFKEMNDGIVIGNIHDNPELIGGEKQ